MLHDKIVPFRFKGNRTYVQGPDIYDSLLEMLRNFFGQYPANVKGSFHYLLENSGIFRIYERDETLEVGNFAAIFSILIKEKKYQVILFDTGTPIFSSYEYDERKVLETMVLEDKTIKMYFKPTYTYMEQFVAMTKKLHLTIYPEAKGKWLFTKIQINDAIDNALYAGKMLIVESERNFQSKLTQCSIRLDDQVIGHIFFSLIPQKELE